MEDKQILLGGVGKLSESETIQTGGLRVVRGRGEI